MKKTTVLCGTTTAAKAPDLTSQKVPGASFIMGVGGHEVTNAAEATLAAL